MTARPGASSWENRLVIFGGFLGGLFVLVLEGFRGEVTGMFWILLSFLGI